jgi:hypothetical protein
MAEFAKMVKNDCGLKLKPITTRNPQANTIIERVHQTIGNIIRTFNVQSMDSDDPWTGILAAAMFAVRHASYDTSSLANAISIRPRCNPKHKTCIELGTHSTTKTNPN